MLLNNFFFIDELKQEEQKIIAAIHINADHAILKGHFPQQAVVPGVCVLEMMKEVLQIALSKKMKMTESVMIKLLTIFSPPTNTKAQFELDYKIGIENQFHVQAVLRDESTVFFKFKGILEGK